MDINPGDRSEKCHGMMKPISIEKEGKTMFIVQRCENCGHERRNKQSPEDNLDQILLMMRNGV